MKHASAVVTGILLGALSVSLGAMALAADPAAKCAKSKLKLAGKKDSGLLGCDAKAVSKGTPHNDMSVTDCFNKVKGKFGSGWDKAEGKGGCVTTGDKGAIENKVDNHVSDLEGSLGTSGQSKCTSGQLKGAGKKGACSLGCVSKAAGKGLPFTDTTVSDCRTKCRDKFNNAFTKATGAGGCLGSANESTIEGKVDAFVNDVATELETTTTTSTSTTTSIPTSPLGPRDFTPRNGSGNSSFQSNALGATMNVATNPTFTGVIHLISDTTPNPVTGVAPLRIPLCVNSNCTAAGNPCPCCNGSGTGTCTGDGNSRVGFQLLDGSFLCNQFIAAGSTGVIDCDGGATGGTKVDVTASQDSNDHCAIHATTGPPTCHVDADCTLAHCVLGKCDLEPAQDCNTDSDCVSSTCPAPRCKSGHCADNNAVCADDTGCTATSCAVPCIQDTDCPTQTCTAGTCTITGQTCTGDPDCAMYCRGGQCTSDTTQTCSNGDDVSCGGPPKTCEDGHRILTIGATTLARPGDGFIRLRYKAARCTSSADPTNLPCPTALTSSADCLNPAKVDFTKVNGVLDDAFGTGPVTAIMTHVRQGGPDAVVSPSNTHNFDCGNWQVDGPGTMALPLTAPDTGNPLLSPTCTAGHCSNGATCTTSGPECTTVDADNVEVLKD